MRWLIKISLAVVLLSAAGVTQAQAQNRFSGLDRDRDGVITRSEWRGNDASFRAEDWNGDGVLSGDEVRPGARRPVRATRDWNRDGVIDQQDTLLAQRFQGYDRNGNGQVTAAEWNAADADRALFTRLDADRNRFVTLEEYAYGGGMRMDSQGGPENRFSTLDKNNNGLIARNEWNVNAGIFDRLDSNRDNQVNRVEFDALSSDNSEFGNKEVFDLLDPPGPGPFDVRPDHPLTPFDNADSNRDGRIVRIEWQWDEASFNRMDANGDHWISGAEFDTAANQAAATNRFSAADRNQDGSIARSEWSWDSTWFDRIDTNDDNRIVSTEFEAAQRYFNAGTSRFEDTDSAR